MTLAAVSGSGTMNLTLLGKTTDVLYQHDFQVSNFVVSPNNLTMTFSGASVSLGWINNNTVWKSLNDTYVGASGPSAPANQMRGSISPADFPGIPSGYYVVLSLSITSQPANNIPFVVNPIANQESIRPETPPDHPKALSSAVSAVSAQLISLLPPKTGHEERQFRA